MASPTITFYSQQNDSKTDSDHEEDLFEPQMLFELLTQRYRCGQRVFIRCLDQQQMLALDELLWSVDTHSFLAHGLDGESSSAKAPIVLGLNLPENIGGFACWVNLTESALLPIPTTREILEIVPRNEVQKQQARDRYKDYCKNGIRPEFLTLKPAPKQAGAANVDR